MLSGFIAATPDSTAVPPLPTYAGHVFGLFGQGNATMPADDIAIAGDFLLTYGSETFGMMVSIFPYDMNTANMAAGNSIDIEVKTVTFKEMSDIRVPYTPTPVTIVTD